MYVLIRYFPQLSSDHLFLIYYVLKVDDYTVVIVEYLFRFKILVEFDLSEFAELIKYLIIQLIVDQFY